MTDLVPLLGRLTGRPVLDRTGFTGKFSFALTYSIDAAPTNTPPSGPRNPSEIGSLITELEKQVGLKLTSTKERVDVLVVDHVEKPSPN
jgi:uncharacterized protein (TIGR03435 family)